ncbi:histidine kinase [Actinoplanes sp. NPDC024001]|uniref:sensor histidine kinase n=1 Tax=Actinoplanes sp. NPDC024001 TaxID=3154598 RepID=UPI0033CF867D
MSRARDRVVDTAVAAGVAAVLAVIVSAGQGGQAGAVAYVWAAGLGALMFWRRRYAPIVLVVTVLGLFAYYAAGLPAIGVAVPVAAALYAAAEAGHRRLCVAVAAGVLAVSMGFRLFEGQDFRYVVLYEGIGHVALMAAAITLGELVRARRRIARLTGRQIELEAGRRIDEHNRELSRELHDSIGHRLTVAAIHANVARQEAARRPEAAAAALEHVAEAVSEALAQLRGTVRDLRTATPARPGPEDVGTLLEAARAAGFRVHAEVDAAAVTAVAFQVIRESVTNALRHSAGRTVEVEVRRRDDGTVLVRVADDGTTGGPADAEGTGLTGLRERVTRMGGRFGAGPTAYGWRVEAIVPLEAAMLAGSSDA